MSLGAKLAFGYRVTDWHNHREGTTGRALTYGMYGVPADEMTVKKCVVGCADANFILAGVEYGGECCKSLSLQAPHYLALALMQTDCGDTIVNGGNPADVDQCDMACKGNKTELCGGSSHLNLYDFELQYSGGRVTSAASR